jgi:hypothetical protein
VGRLAPPGLVLQAIQAQACRSSSCARAAAGGNRAADVGGMALLRYQLRHGVVNSGSRESVRAARRGTPAHAHAACGMAANCCRRSSAASCAC